MVQKQRAHGHIVAIGQGLTKHILLLEMDIGEPSLTRAGTGILDGRGADIQRCYLHSKSFLRAETSHFQWYVSAAASNIEQPAWPTTDGFGGAPHLGPQHLCAAAELVNPVQAGQCLAMQICVQS